MQTRASETGMRPSHKFGLQKEINRLYKFSNNYRGIREVSKGFLQKTLDLLQCPCVFRRQEICDTCTPSGGAASVKCDTATTVPAPDFPHTDKTTSVVTGIDTRLSGPLVLMKWVLTSNEVWNHFSVPDVVLSDFAVRWSSQNFMIRNLHGSDAVLCIIESLAEEKTNTNGRRSERNAENVLH